jgi:inorganic triphosphatase YgiF
MAPGAEVELKFLFAEKDLAKLKAFLSAIAGAREVRRQRLRTIYFDTPTQDLWRSGFILRVREAGQKHYQTIKRLAPSSVQRDEWEQETAGPEPDLSHVKASPLAHLAGRPSIRRALRPAFDVDIERTSVCLESAGGLVEASLDQGSISAHGESVPVCELELELKTGELSSLFSLARSFVAQLPLHLSLISKAERGHILAQGGWGRAVKGSRPRLETAETCQQAFKEICRTCLHDFHLNIPALRTFDPVEGVHQARVAIRRLRAAITLFTPIVQDGECARFRKELKWLARLLGAARDLDVLQANLVVHLSQGEAMKGAAAPSVHCEAKRDRAFEGIIDALDSQRGRRLFLDLVEWIEAGQWQSASAALAGQPLQEFVRRQLNKRWRKLVRGSAALAKLGPDKRHKIRLEAKRLRYMAEFFVAAPSFASDRPGLTALVNQCETMQDALGTIRDEEAMAKFMKSEPVTLSSADRKRLKSRIAKQLKAAVRSHSKLASIKPL